MKTLIILFGILLVAALGANGQTCPDLPSSTNVIVLLNNNNLLWFSPNSTSFRAMQITGVNGKLQTIDVRPRGRALWGISTAYEIYRINLENGVATPVSNLTSLLPKKNLNMDFNPTVDRLRLVSTYINFRVNVDNGGVTIDGNIKYADQDSNEGNFGKFVGLAYTNNFDGATSTTLYGIDSQDKKSFYLVAVNPPNDGTLTTIGELKVKGQRFGGFDIHTSADGCNTAIFATEGKFWNVDLTTGLATQVWQATSEYLDEYLCNYDIWGLAIL